MSIITRFAGRINAINFAYGAFPRDGFTKQLTVGIGNTATGAGTITVTTYTDADQGGSAFNPLSILAPITIGIGANAETVTPTAIGAPSLSGFAPGPLSVTVSATFANLHGNGEPITSGTFGLQEAINTANAAGGGEVVIDAAWYGAGGTAAMIAAATLPTNGTVTIEDVLNGVDFSLGATSTTVVAAPAALTSSLIASSTTAVGTWTAGTLHAVVSYVTAIGGETLTSADYSFTTTLNFAVAGTGPIAATDAVGYRLYLSVVGSAVDYLVPVTAANGTVIQCGPIAAFKIGTSFSVATPTVNTAAIIPVQSSAFGGIKPVSFTDVSMAQSFQTVSGPFAVTGVVTAGTAAELGHIQLPLAFLNQVYKTVRVTFDGYYTPVSTATLILTLELHSIYGATKTTLWTVTTPASSGTTAAVINGVINLSTATTGTAGTVEAHGFIVYGGATGTAGLLVSAGDSVITVSSAANLTTQDTLVLTVNSGTANLTTSQLRRLRIEVLE